MSHALPVGFESHLAEPDTLKELILVTPRDGKRPKLSTIISNVRYFVPLNSCVEHL
jgi:hypothetical protein